MNAKAHVHILARRAPSLGFVDLVRLGSSVVAAFLLAACGHPIRDSRYAEDLWHVWATREAVLPNGRKVALDLPELVPGLPVSSGEEVLMTAEKLQDENEDTGLQPPVVVLRGSGYVEVDAVSFMPKSHESTEESDAYREVKRRLEATEGFEILTIAPDRSVSWSQLLPWVRFAKGQTPLASAVAILVRRERVGQDVLGLGIHDDVALVSTPLDVELLRERSGAIDRVQLNVGDWSRTFAPATGFDDPAFVTRASRAWDGFIEAFHALSGGTNGIVIRVDPTVPCAYPLMLLDVLAHRGMGTVRQEGEVLHVPQRTGWYPPVRGAGGAPDYYHAWLWATLLGVGAVVVVWLPLMWRSRRFAKHAGG